MAETNITEFNAIAGLVFAQLYRIFPKVMDIDEAAIAQGMGVTGDDWSKHKLALVRAFPKP